MYGGIEVGGIKFVCVVLEDGEILEKISIFIIILEEILD